MTLSNGIYALLIASTITLVLLGSVTLSYYVQPLRILILFFGMLPGVSVFTVVYWFSVESLFLQLALVSVLCLIGFLCWVVVEDRSTKARELKANAAKK